MKTLAFVAGILFLASRAVVADPQTARIEVSGLFCSSCSYIAGEALKEAPSVEVIGQIPNETGDSAVYIVNYDDTVTTLAEIVAQPALYGYDARLVTDDDKT